MENREAVNHPQMAIAASVLCDENTAHCERCITLYSAVYIFPDQMNAVFDFFLIWPKELFIGEVNT